MYKGSKISFVKTSKCLIPIQLACNLASFFRWSDKESDIPDPVDIYGKSKLMLDEIISLNIYKNVSTILPGSIVTKARPGIL